MVGVEGESAFASYFSSPFENWEKVESESVCFHFASCWEGSVPSMCVSHLSVYPLKITNNGIK